MPVASHLVRFEKMCRFASIFTQSNIKLLKNHRIQNMQDIRVESKS